MSNEWFRPAVSPDVLSGDRVQALTAIRDRLAAELDNPDIAPRDVASVAKQLADVVRELDAIPNASAEVSPVVDITKRRESRRKAANTHRS